MILKVSKVFSIAISLLMLTVACAHSSSIEEAASLYCESYSPSTWESLGSGADVSEIYNHIVTVQKAKIKDAAFMQAIENSDNKDFVSFYQSARVNIEKLLGGIWNCEAFDQFYFPQQTLTSISLQEVYKKRINPDDANTLVIAISHSGEVLVNNSPLASTTMDVIKLGVNSRIRGRDINGLEIVLYADQGSDGVLLSRVMRSLAEIGVSKVSLIDY